MADINCTVQLSWVWFYRQYISRIATYLWFDTSIIGLRHVITMVFPMCQYIPKFSNHWCWLREGVPVLRPCGRCSTWKTQVVVRTSHFSALTKTETKTKNPLVCTLRICHIIGYFPYFGNFSAVIRSCRVTGAFRICCPALLAGTIGVI